MSMQFSKIGVIPSSSSPIVYTLYQYEATRSDPTDGLGIGMILLHRGVYCRTDHAEGRGLHINAQPLPLSLLLYIYTWNIYYYVYNAQDTWCMWWVQERSL